MLAASSGTHTRRAACAIDSRSRSISPTSLSVSVGPAPTGAVLLVVAVAVIGSSRSGVARRRPLVSVRAPRGARGQQRDHQLVPATQPCSAASVESWSCSSCGIRTITRPECRAFGSFVRMPMMS